jgi:hypothetical protein
MKRCRSEETTCPIPSELLREIFLFANSCSDINNLSRAWYIDAPGHITVRAFLCLYSVSRLWATVMHGLIRELYVILVKSHRPIQYFRQSPFLLSCVHDLIREVTFYATETMPSQQTAQLLAACTSLTLMTLKPTPFLQCLTCMTNLTSVSLSVTDKDALFALENYTRLTDLSTANHRHDETYCFLPGLTYLSILGPNGGSWSCVDKMAPHLKKLHTCYTHDSMLLLSNLTTLEISKPHFHAFSLVRLKDMVQIRNLVLKNTEHSIRIDDIVSLPRLVSLDVRDPQLTGDLALLTALKSLTLRSVDYYYYNRLYAITTLTRLTHLDIEFKNVNEARPFFESTFPIVFKAIDDIATQNAIRGAL